MGKKSEIIQKLRDLAYKKRMEAEELDNMARKLQYAYPWATDEELAEAEKKILEEQ